MAICSTRHLGVASGPGEGTALDELIAQLTADFDALQADVRALGRAGRVSPPASADVLQAMGELASSRIVAAAFRQQRLPRAWVDSRQVLVTDAEHTAAIPDMDATYASARRSIVAAKTAPARFPCMGGFIGATPRAA